MIISILNFLVIFALAFLLGQNRKYKNLMISFIISSFFTLEGLSYMFFGNPITEEFLFFAFNLQIYFLLETTYILMIYYVFLMYLAIFIIIFIILQKFSIKKYKYKKYIVTIFLLFLLSPIGFLYKIFYVFIVNYFYDYNKFKNKTYNEIFLEQKGIEYVTKSKLKVKKENLLNYKNLVIIYLESFDSSYLNNKDIKIYTQNINSLSKKAEFYSHIEQIEKTNGTLAGIITTQCGMQYDAYFLFKNPYNTINSSNELVCLPDILNKAGYYSVFIGGADKRLFNKGNFLLSHSYNRVEDLNSLMSKNKKLKKTLSNWGISDYDVFKEAKKEYLNLSKFSQPFNLTILTTATHSPNGYADIRCKNTSSNKLLNAIECTDYLVNDFINFISKQKKFSNTIIVILPDHIQYFGNSLKTKISDNEKTLYAIFLNTNNKKEYQSAIDYTNLAEIILKRLNVQSNATFFNKQNNDVVKNFINKIHISQ